MKLSEFWTCVARRGHDECWLWMRGRTGLGYGQFCNPDGTIEYSHRVAAKLSGMDVHGLVVMHRCDNPPCCNPAHLAPATQRQNMLDKVSKGRGNYSRGEHHPSAKLTTSSVSEIRRLYQQGLGQRELGRRFGVSHKNIAAIVNGETWK